MKKKGSKEITLNIRMSGEDKEKIKTLAAAEGMGMSAYLREKALGQKPEICHREGMEDILEEIDWLNGIFRRIWENGDGEIKAWIEEIVLGLKARRGGSR